MKRSADYESDNGVLRVRPIMIYDPEEKEEPVLNYITILAGSGKVHINIEYIHELEEILQCIQERYIHKDNIKLNKESQ